MPKQLHPHLSVPEFSHLFDVPSGLAEAANIGKWCVYKDPTCGIERENMFVIGSLQYDYAGQLCYRVYANGDQVGRVARLTEIAIIQVQLDVVVS